jgi:hypothetical protein
VRQFANPIFRKAGRVTPCAPFHAQFPIRGAHGVARPASFRCGFVGASVAALVLCAPQSVLACATCYGASDSPMAQGMNWGIATLLVVILSVLGGVVGFFVHVGFKSAALNRRQPAQPQTDTRS